MRLILAILISLLSFSSCIKEKNSAADLKQGDSLPEFSVVMSDGTIVSDRSLKGEVSIVMFFHTTCPDCRKALPEMQRIYDEYLPQGVRFALISREQDAASVEQYWRENELSMPYSAQTDRKVYNLFAGSRIPRIYVSDARGIIRAIFTDDPVPEYSDISAAIDVL